MKIEYTFTIIGLFGTILYALLWQRLVSAIYKEPKSVGKNMVEPTKAKVISLHPYRDSAKIEEEVKTFKKQINWIKLYKYSLLPIIRVLKVMLWPVWAITKWNIGLVLISGISYIISGNVGLLVGKDWGPRLLSDGTYHPTEKSWFGWKYKFNYWELLEPKQ